MVQALVLILVLTTVAHTALQYINGTISVDRQTTGRFVASRFRERFITLLSLSGFIISMALQTSQYKWAHPIQVTALQIFGSVVLALHALVFLQVHINMGKSWSPVPQAKVQHELVEEGLFRFARHPMYANFIWATPSVFLATLNWLVAVTWGLGWIALAIYRIPKEEDILIELFGRSYLNYRHRVGALGPRWCIHILNGPGHIAHLDANNYGDGGPDGGGDDDDDDVRAQRAAEEKGFTG